MKLYISENLKRLRLERKLTQEQVAMALGLSFQSVSRWETGMSYPDLETIPALALFYGITIDELVGMDKITRENQRKEFDKCLAETTSLEEKLQILRKMYLSFPEDKNVLYRLTITLAESGKQYYSEAQKLLIELERMPGIERCWIDAVVKALLPWVPEEECADFIKKYGAEVDMRYEVLMEERTRKYNVR